MKLGRDTNSLINYMLSGTKGQPTPEIGMGATRLLWTDRKACTIVEVSPNGKRIGVRQDECIRTDTNGMSEDQQYSYAPTDGPAQMYYTLRRNGAWVKEGESMNGGERLRIGERREYHDFSF